MTRESPTASGAPARAQELVDETPAEEPRAASASLAVERRLLSRLLAALSLRELAIVLWDGRVVCLPGASPAQRLIVRDRAALWRMLAFADYYFPEMYAEGRVLVEGDLVGLLGVVQRARQRMDRGGLGRRLSSALFRPSPGSRERARENIHHHYDLGNDFYRLWLDEGMLYTCAYYEDPGVSLERAQTAKMDHVCRKLRLQPGERVVEAGCGWGSLALHMARHYGVKVRAYNISRAQLELARERASAEGLDARVEFVEDDYRSIRDECDAFVSVGMLEHVGPGHYPELGRVMARSLLPHGRGLLHTIGTDRPGPMNAWIERRIFPGAYPPSLEELTPMLGSQGFSVLDVENLRMHYARTLADWLERFEGAREQVSAMYDERFVRTWRFYLASSQTAFETGHLQLFQVLFARRGCNAIPWTRAHLYPASIAGAAASSTLPSHFQSIRARSW
jgi:cyclopropane-fatty-acyl-phospholipid synthase